MCLIDAFKKCKNSNLGNSRNRPSKNIPNIREGIAKLKSVSADGCHAVMSLLKISFILAFSLHAAVNGLRPGG